MNFVQSKGPLFTLSTELQLCGCGGGEGCGEGVWSELPFFTSDSRPASSSASVSAREVSKSALLVTLSCRVQTGILETSGGWEASHLSLPEGLDNCLLMLTFILCFTPWENRSFINTFWSAFSLLVWSSSIISSRDYQLLVITLFFIGDLLQCHREIIIFYLFILYLLSKHRESNL